MLVSVKMSGKTPRPAASDVIYSLEHILPIIAPLRKNFHVLLSLLPYLKPHAHWLYAVCFLRA
jgi:hypothetical protein